MNFGLKPEILSKINAVFSKYPQIEQALIFGSRAKGTFKNGSDIDITFKGKDIDLTVINRIANDLDDLLLPYSFDLSAYNHLTDKAFLEHIDRIGMIFYQK